MEAFGECETSAAADRAIRESLFYLVIVRHRDCQGPVKISLANCRARNRLSWAWRGSRSRKIGGLTPNAMRIVTFVVAYRLAEIKGGEVPQRSFMEHQSRELSRDLRAKIARVAKARRAFVT